MRHILLCSISALALSAFPASAFGLRTHLYIAEQVYLDLADDCHLELAGEVVAVRSTLCRQIKDNKGAFLAGALGPDAFPDLIVGQTFVHPGTPDGRQTADWLELVLAEARTDEEVAFAYGQLMHASGDVFAHSYVNNYAGDVFELTARWHKDVEERHFKLEKYIDQRLAYAAPYDDLSVPADLLVRSMVQTSYLPGNLTLTADDLKALRGGPSTLSQAAARIIAVKLGRAAPASHLGMMQTMLAISSTASRSAVCDEIGSVNRLTAAFLNYVAAEHAAREGRSAPPPLTAGPPPQEFDCDPADLDRAEARLAEAEQSTGALPYSDEAINQRGRWLGGPDARRANLAVRYQRYADASRDRERTRGISVQAPLWAEDVRSAVKAYIEASLDAAKLMVRNSEPIPPAPHQQRSSIGVYENWWECWGPVFRGAPAKAAEALCDRIESLGVDRSISRITLEAGAGETPRGLLFSYLDLQDQLSEFRDDLLFGLTSPFNPSASHLARAMLEPKRVSREDLDEAFQENRNGQLAFECVSDWIDRDLGLLPPGAPLEPRGDCLKGPAGMDAARLGDTLQPHAFQPLQHAVTLGKLALLDETAIRSLAAALGARDQMRLGTPISRDRYSVVLDMARSLDGSYQWQGLSMPAPRSRPIPRVTPTVGAGYPYQPQGIVLPFDATIRSRPGFPFYQSADLRLTAFARLFPKPFEGEILRRAEYGPGHYPFRPCVGDPFRPLLSDLSRLEVCVTTTERPPARVPDTQGLTQEVRDALRQAYQDYVRDCVAIDRAEPPSDRASVPRIRIRRGCLYRAQPPTPGS